MQLNIVVQDPRSWLMKLQRNVLATLVAICAIWSATPAFSQGLPDSSPLLSVRAAGRFLDQASWGPTMLSIEQLQQQGIDAWLDAQFALNTSDLPDQAILTSTGQSNNDLSPVQRAFFQNALGGSDQLRQRLAFALSQMWVVSAVGVPQAYAYPPYWRIFRDNAFGNYRDIIQAVTLNPAMGRYLNMANNNKANPTKGTAANENYARELMQLFTLGLTQLHSDGTAVLDSSGNPLPTYNQTTVTNLARALTGWTYPAQPGITPAASGNNPAYFVGQMYAVETNHDITQKPIFDGITIPPGQTAEQDLNSVIDALMRQPTMAPFVCSQLIQHLVTSNPSPAYVSRCSAVFGNNASGVAGDMKAVVREILTDSEARAADDPSVTVDSAFGHMREPILFMANVLRALNGTVGSTSKVYNTASLLGQQLFYPPTVFSYFSPQYRATNGLLAPEFQIYSTQTAANRADAVNSLIFSTLDPGTSINLGLWIQDGNSTDALIYLANQLFLHNSMSSALNNAARTAAAAATTPTARVQAVLYVVLSSAEYQIVH